MRLIRYASPFVRPSSAVAPVARDPWSLFDSEIDRLFSPIFGNGALQAPVQFDGDENQYTVRVVLPGVKREAISVEWLDNAVELVVKGQATDKDQPAPEYRRSISIPGDVQVDKIKASLEDGILTLTLPKAESAKPRRIELN